MRELSKLEEDILLAIDHCGWYASLWFPIVQRELMNLGSDAPDEQVHAAFLRLVREGLIREVLPGLKEGDLDLNPHEWRSDSEALARVKARRQRD